MILKIIDSKDMCFWSEVFLIITAFFIIYNGTNVTFYNNALFHCCKYETQIQQIMLLSFIFIFISSACHISLFDIRCIIYNFTHFYANKKLRLEWWTVKTYDSVAFISFKWLHSCQSIIEAERRFAGIIYVIYGFYNC